MVGSVSDPSKLPWGTLRATSLHAEKCGRQVAPFDRHLRASGVPIFLGRHLMSPRAWKHPHEAPPEVSSAIDLLVLISRSERCPDRLEECIESFPNLKAVNVVSGGFRETPGGQELELRMAQIAHDAGLRLVGPNSVGVIDSYSEFASMFLRKFPKPGGVSLISQSGGLCGAVVELLSSSSSEDYNNEMGMSKVISLGNAADIGFIDGLEAVADDPNTDVILLYMEGLGTKDVGDEFIHLARTISAEKPILALKAGATAAGARAVRSHTGSLAGDRQIFSAALREAGIVQADSLQRMLEMAQALSCRSRVSLVSSSASASAFDEDKKYRVAILTNAGGPAAITVDALANTEAASLPILPETVQTALHKSKNIHPLSATSNPVDMLGGASPQSYKSALDVLLSSSEVDAVVSLHVPTVHTCPNDLATATIAAAHSFPSKPVVGMIVSNDREFIQPATSMMNSANIPTFCHAEAAGSAFRAWREREMLLSKDDNVGKISELSGTCVKEVRDYLNTLDQSGWILEHDARKLLDIIGIRQPKADTVPSGSSLEDVLAAAESIGYPVVLKRQDLVHKSDKGGVALNLRSDSDVEAALQVMFPSVDSFHAPILVCEYISNLAGLSSVREFFIGTTRDEMFGPAVCFGTGGVLVESIGDVAFSLPPRCRQDTLDLLRRTRLASHRLRGGIRSEPPLDASVVADTLERIADLVRNFPEIVELDINPLMVGLAADNQTTLVAADVKFRLNSPSED